MTTMPLSQAIRLAAMSTEPVHGPAYRTDGGRVCGTCAIGAVMYAIHGDAAVEKSGGCVTTAIRAAMSERWPWTAAYTLGPKLPRGGYVHGAVRPITDVMGIMLALFENERWTREQIADWVESLERQQQIPPADPQALLIDVFEEPDVQRSEEEPFTHMVSRR
jgi:hypothetical protein